MKVINRNCDELNANMVGKTLKVHAESVSKNDDNLMTGRSETNVLVHFKADESVIGKIVDVKIVDFKTFYLTGELID